MILAVYRRPSSRSGSVQSAARLPIASALREL
jgi:hypothetical protein